MLLAAMGTLFAVLSCRDGRKITRDLRAVFDHLTTKALGPFPDYMNDVERLIVNARDSVLIAVDFPGYGVWADRGRYGTLVKALENRKAERVRTGHKFDVQLLVLDAKGRERSLQDHFPDSSWREYVKRGSFARSRRIVVLTAVVNGSVHRTTVGIPSFSSSVALCKLHPVQDPQSPIAVMTRSARCARSASCSGSASMPD